MPEINLFADPRGYELVSAGVTHNVAFALRNAGDPVILDLEYRLLSPLPPLAGICEMTRNNR